jgi:threonine/homoserine/homoserine lactone efflux protein
VSASNVLAWSALAAVLTVTPGVDMALVARSAIAQGRTSALWATWGIVTGLLVWAAASAIGIAAILAASATAYDALRLAGAAYLVWLGVRTFLRGGRTAAAPGPPAGGRSSYLTGLASNLANPKIVVFYSTVLPGFIPHGAPVLGWSLAFAGIHAAMGLVWLSGYAWALDRARGLLDRPRVRAVLDRVTGTVLVGLGLRLALDRR